MTTTRRKKKKSAWNGRMVTVSLSLCLLAVMAMAGMYAVGKNEQEQAELEEEIAKAEELAKAQEEARQQRLEEELERQAASAAAKRQKEKEEEVIWGAELESEFVIEPVELADLPESEDMEEPEEASGEALAEQEPLSFSPDTDTVLWPVAGNIILDYSMDRTVYFSTLDQYKYNPAVIIQGSLDESVLCGAQGRISSIEVLEETGTTVTVNIGNGYELIYGQLKELTAAEGDYVKEGDILGYVSEPTHYYSREGSNVYFEIRKDGESIDPMSLLS